MTKSAPVTQASRLVAIEGVINFRDLGGYQNQRGESVRWGKAYRSAQLDRLTSDGVLQMQALGIQTVVDLRFSDESMKHPTIRAAVPDAEMLSWHLEQQNNMNEAVKTKSASVVKGWRDSLESRDPNQVREAMRINYPQKLYSHAAIYRKMLLSLINGATPMVFHCAAGKDRTGVAAALILGLLGVDRQTIIEDYLVTQSQMGDLLNSWLAGGATGNEQYADFQKQLLELPQELVKPVFEADQAYIETLLDYVDSEYQGFENYALNVLNLNMQELNQLSELMLETDHR